MSTPTATAPGTRWYLSAECLWVAAATVAWITAYRTILPFWNWAIYDLVGLDPASHWGWAAHLFQGYANVANLSGAIQRWAAKGFPVHGTYVPVAAGGGCCGALEPNEASATAAGRGCDEGECGCDGCGCDC